MRKPPEAENLYFHCVSGYLIVRETRKTFQDLMGKIKTVEMVYWRICVRKIRSERIKNEEILKEMGLRKEDRSKSSRKEG